GDQHGAGGRPPHSPNRVVRRRRLALVSLLLRPHPTSTLLPYPTLFRSQPRPEFQSPDVATNGQGANGQAPDGHGQTGQTTNGQGTNGHVPPGQPQPEFVPPSNGAEYAYGQQNGQGTNGQGANGQGTNGQSNQPGTRFRDAVADGVVAREQLANLHEQLSVAEVQLQSFEDHYGKQFPPNSEQAAEHARLSSQVDNLRVQVTESTAALQRAEQAARQADPEAWSLVPGLDPAGLQ